jgi:transcriptional regulator with XRE-family HTH domain
MHFWGSDVISPQQCRAARAGLEWSRSDLANKAGLAERTVNDFERGAREPHANNRGAIRAAFEREGVTFTDEGCVCFATKAPSA